MRTATADAAVGVEPTLLDEEILHCPAWLSDDELFNHTSPGWRRSGRPPEDPENDA